MIALVEALAARSQAVAAGAPGTQAAQPPAGTVFDPELASSGA